MRQRHFRPGFYGYLIAHYQQRRLALQYTLDLRGEAGRGVGGTGNRALRVRGFQVPLLFDFDFGRRSGVVVPDLGPLLFEGLRSGTLETERSRPPAPGHTHFPTNGRGAQRPDLRAVTCPGFVRPLRGRRIGQRFAIEVAVDRATARPFD